MTQIALSLWGSKVMCGRYQEQLQAFLKVDKKRKLFSCLVPAEKLILGVLFISEGCIMKEKARRSSFEVSEMRYITILICPCHLANF